MTRLEQLIFNICNKKQGSIMFIFKLKSEAKRSKYRFGDNDELFLKKLIDIGIINKEELFCEWLDLLINTLEINARIIDEFPDHFSPDAYFPDLSNKDVGEGAWIRIPTEYGFNIYYAKSSMRKVDYNRTIKNLEAKIKFFERKNTMSDAKSLKKAIKTIDNYNQNEILLAEQAIGIDPYYVAYKASKSKKMYARPHEYELIKDIEFYMNSVSDRIRLKPYFKGDIKDQIFYLQSRGISKNIAIKMVVSGQAYFEVDIKGMIQDEHEANKHFYLSTS
jgi:hypothetical protein